jgi:hypothetical protein
MPSRFSGCYKARWRRSGSAVLTRRYVPGLDTAAPYAAQISRQAPLRDYATEFLKFAVDLRAGPILVSY